MQELFPAIGKAIPSLQFAVKKLKIIQVNVTENILSTVEVSNISTSQMEASILDESGIFGNKIVTEISDLPIYYPAEEYHQNYFNLHPEQGYCAFVVSPKVAKFREQFKDLLM